jgi:hypothetical protein
MSQRQIARRTRAAVAAGRDTDLSITGATTYSARKYAVGAVIGNGSNNKQIRMDDCRCKAPKKYVVKCEREYIDAQSSLLVHFTVRDEIALTTDPK